LLFFWLRSIILTTSPAVNSYINQACKDNGVTITSGPVATATGFSTVFGGYSSAALSAYSSYTSAHPSGFNSADWASFTSAYGISNSPQPTGAPGGFGGFGGFGGAGGFGGFGVGAGGWSPSEGGPFGGAGFGPFGSAGPWTAGPWTKWWGGDNCPASTWSGWTSGSWSSSAPWTTWSACTASVTGTQVYTTTFNGVATTVSSYDYKVAQATGSAGSGTTGNAAAPTKVVGAGAAGLALLGAVLAL
jgi:hypothetical protein